MFYNMFANGLIFKVKEEGWQTVSSQLFTKFQKSKMPKKYLEPGTSVICIHNKVGKP